jgi:hypothetical protein
MSRRKPAKTVTRTNLVVSLPGQEVFGTAASLESIRAIFARVPRLTATLLLTKLLVHFDPEKIMDWIEFDRSVLRSFLLRPRVRSLVNLRDPRDPERLRVTVHRQQLLVGLSLAQSWCPEQEAPTTDPEAYYLIGEALLGISDLLDSARVPSGDSSISGIGATLLSYFAESNPPDPRFALLRTARLIGRPEWFSDPVLGQFRERFETAAGLTLREYLYVLVGLFVRLEVLHQGKRLDTLRSWEDFGAGSLTPKVRAALEELSIRFSDLPRLVDPPDKVLREQLLEPFRSHALISLSNDRFLYADYVFGTQQATNGLLWRLRRLAGSDVEGEALLRSWGSLLEGYLHDLLGEVLGSRYVCAPRDDDRNEVTDALVDYGDEVVLLEFKRGFIRHGVKYSSDVGKLEEELQRKFVKEGQIARALVRLFGGERLGSRWLSAMKGLGARAPRVVYPVLVTDDWSLAAHGVESHLGDLVAESLKGVDLPSRPRVERLTVATLENVESLVPILRGGAKLSNILRDRFKVDRPALNTLHNFLCDVANRMRLEALVDRAEVNRVLDAAKEFWARAREAPVSPATG